MKKVIRLTEEDLHQIVKESVRKIVSETSDDKLNRAIDASKDKQEKYKEIYGSNSIPYHHARKQGQYFEKAYDDRYKTASPSRRAKMEKGRIDLRNKREGTTAGERERAKQKNAEGNPKNKKSFFGKIFK